MSCLCLWTKQQWVISKVCSCFPHYTPPSFWGRMENEAANSLEKFNMITQSCVLFFFLFGFICGFFVCFAFFLITAKILGRASAMLTQANSDIGLPRKMLTRWPEHDISVLKHVHSVQMRSAVVALLVSSSEECNSFLNEDAVGDNLIKTWISLF